MNKIFIIVILFVLNQNKLKIDNGIANEIYEDNLNRSCELYLLKKNIPDDILLTLAPKNYKEFELYYGTTGPDHKMYETNFFYDTTQLIFEKVTIEKNYEFYLPSLQLANFSDGEYGETFDYYLKQIIDLDQKRFCESVKNLTYPERNPIKWYYEKLKCE